MKKVAHPTSDSPWACLASLCNSLAYVSSNFALQCVWKVCNAEVLSDSPRYSRKQYDQRLERSHSYLALKKSSKSWASFFPSFNFLTNTSKPWTPVKSVSWTVARQQTAHTGELKWQLIWASRRQTCPPAYPKVLFKFPGCHCSDSGWERKIRTRRI